MSKSKKKQTPATRLLLSLDEITFLCDQISPMKGNPASMSAWLKLNDAYLRLCANKMGK